MKTAIMIILTSVCVMVPVFARQVGQRYETEQPKVRFVSLPVYIDSGSLTLAAYQFELKTKTGQVKIVGVENGEHPAFAQPPYYDTAALAKDRIIIAAFNTGKNLPTGRTRVTTLQLQIIGQAEPQYELILTVTADAEGKEIPAKISYGKAE
jgi:hypothetical protein